jgi:hypothetical protein
MRYLQGHLQGHLLFFQSLIIQDNILHRLNECAGAVGYFSLDSRIALVSSSIALRFF